MSSSYRELVAWQKARRLVPEVYSLTRQFPRDELFALTQQLRRAAVSVPSNIAEGAGRFSHREFQQFLSQARGSLLEMETQILIAQDLAYITEIEAVRVLALRRDVSQLVSPLRTSLTARENEQRTTNNEQPRRAASAAR